MRIRSKTIPLDAYNYISSFNKLQNSKNMSYMDISENRPEGQTGMENSEHLADPRLCKRQISNQEKVYKLNDEPLLKAISYNVWNNSSYWQERIGAITKLIKTESPDVVCLIDVTEQAFHMISKILDKHYIIFQVFIDEKKQCGIVLLCNRDTVSIPEKSPPYYYDYPTGYGQIIGTELIHKRTGTKFHTLATKLDENPDNDHIRDNQCDVITQVVRKLENYILMGDMNIYHRSEKAEEKLSLVGASSRMIDSWIKIGCPNKVRYTYDGKKNPIIKNKLQVRNARIYYRSRHHLLKVKSISLLGYENISETIKVPPSPYYGLETIFSLKI